MFKQIDITLALETAWDVVLVGSSFASMFFLRNLSPKLRVLIVEKGPLEPHEAQLNSRLPAEQITQDNRSNLPKRWVAHSLFGGNSNCWTGQSPRFHPGDFELRTQHDVGLDWPITYAELEPFYQEAEALMEIAGGGSEHILPRSRPFPFPPHELSLSDKTLGTHDPSWVPAPSARSTGGRRAPCCGNGVCVLCPVDAKYTILTGVQDFVRPNAFLLTGVEARTVVKEGNRATRLLVRTEGRDYEITADLFGLGANAIFNAAILLRSGFSAPDLGRWLHEQASRRVLIDAPVKNGFGGTRITGHGYRFYDGPHRARSAAILIENVNAPFTPRYEPGRWTERIHLKLLAEDLPKAANRVVLENDEPKVIWTGHSDYALRGLDRAVEALPAALPFDVEHMQVNNLGETQAHIQGTTRIGMTKAEGVVDKRLRTHEASNVYILGSSAFPTCSPANPTLTLAALSLYAAASV